MSSAATAKASTATRPCPRSPTRSRRLGADYRRPCSEVERDDGRVVVGPVPAQVLPALDRRALQLVRECGAEPDLVEQVVLGRLIRRLEALRPERRRRRGIL